MKRLLGLLGGVLLTLLLLLGMATLNGRGVRPEPSTGATALTVRLAEYRPPEAERRKVHPPEMPLQRTRRIPEVPLRVVPLMASPPLKLDLPPLAFLQDLDLPLSSDLPEEFFRYEYPLPPQDSPSAYEAEEVDTPPYPIRRPLPPYPNEAKRKGIEGEVRVKVLVDRRGRVVEVKVVEARPKGVFEESVVETLKRWEFSPALLRGEPVDVWVAIPIKFELREG